MDNRAHRASRVPPAAGAWSEARARGREREQGGGTRCKTKAPVPSGTAQHNRGFFLTPARPLLPAPPKGGRLDAPPVGAAQPARQVQRMSARLGRAALPVPVVQGAGARPVPRGHAPGLPLWQARALYLGGALADADACATEDLEEGGWVSLCSHPFFLIPKADGRGALQHAQGRRQPLDRVAGTLSLPPPLPCASTWTRLTPPPPSSQVLSPPSEAPLIVFVNTKSGSNDGLLIMRMFKYLLNPIQVGPWSDTRWRAPLLLPCSSPHPPPPPPNPGL